MRLSAVRLWWTNASGAERCVAVAWVVALLILCGRPLVQPDKRTVYPIYAEAGRSWLNSADLYRPTGRDAYRYSPAVAVLFAPLGLLPDSIGGLLWRVLSGGVFLLAFQTWHRRVAQGTPARTAVLFALLLPLVLGALHNGQSNLLVIGLLLAGCAACMGQHWNVASLCLTGAILFKLYPIAVALLLVMAYPRPLAWRLVVGLGIGAAAPFLSQSPAYVADQYAGWFAHLKANDRQLLDPSQWYRDFRQVWSLWVAPLDYHAYQIVQLVAAAGTAALCRLQWRTGGANGRFHEYILGMGTVWMTVFGPATESATYVLLAPSLATLTENAHRPPHSALTRLLGWGAYGVFLLCVGVNLVPWGRSLHGLGIQPVAGLLFLGALLSSARDHRRIERESADPRARTAARAA
jgi:hypothetical protein